MASVRPVLLVTAALVSAVLAATVEWHDLCVERITRELTRETTPGSPERNGADPTSARNTAGSGERNKAMPGADALGLGRILWPDPVGESWLDALAALRDPARSEAAVRTALEEAIRQAPRAAAPHFYLSRELGLLDDQSGALEEQRRAVRCDRHHGLLRAEIARDQLLEAVRRADRPLLEEAARGFAVAVAVGQIPFEELIVALEAAGAPPGLFEMVADGKPDRLQALVEHHAQAGRYDEALRLGATIDQGTESTRGRVLAHLRVAAALRAAGDNRGAAEQFADAARLSPAPDGFALDRADALLAIGRTQAGVEQLVRAAADATLSPARLAGSLIEASDPRAAILALAGRARTAPSLVRLGLMEATRRLHDSDLTRLLRDRFALTVEVTR